MEGDIMRFILLLLLAAGIVSAALGYDAGNTVAPDDVIVGSLEGQVIGVGEAIGGEMLQNQTQNQTHMENQTQVMEQNQTRERNETGAGEGEQIRAETESQGIAQQVQEIIQYRKNETITVPQGQMVRIIARNRLIEVENISLQFNESFMANFMFQGKNKTFKFGPKNGKVEITDENVTVATNETIELAEDSVVVGGRHVAVMPSALQEKLRARTILSAELHSEEDQLLYQVKAQKHVRIFWLFDADMDVDATVDAETGEVKEQKGPWWAFLASEAG